MEKTASSEVRPLYSRPGTRVNGVSTHLCLLLVEDNDADAAFLGHALQTSDAGVTFLTTRARSLAEAIACLRDNEYDIILLDLNLPDSDGLDTFTSLHAVNRQTAIVILTSTGLDEYATRAVGAGAQDYLFKDHLDPFWIARALMHAIGRVDLLAELQTARERELEAVKAASQAKSDYLAMLSHEIRTPLTALTAAADLLIRHANGDLAMRELVSIIRRNGEHLLKLVGNSLDLSKIEAGRLELELAEFDAEDLVSEAVTPYCYVAAQRQIKIDVQFSDSSSIRLKSDPTRLRQILTNLVSNAVKFSRPGGRVVIEVQRLVQRGRKAMLEVRVADNGIGMSEAQQNRLFQAYGQADLSISRRFGGTGLGLALSRQLAEALGGKLFLESSAADVGSVFVLQLPCLGQQEAWQGGSSLLAGKQILLVDDSPDVLFLLREILLIDGAEVTSANNGCLALTLASENEYDAIVMDIRMPGVDGVTVAKSLREHGSRVPILILSGSSETEDKAACVAAGCNAYLVKHQATAMLVGTLASIMPSAKSAKSP